MAIVTDDDFTDYIKNETGVSDSTMIAAAKATAEEMVIDYCGGAGGWRTFALSDSVVSSRTYVPLNFNTVRVHDFSDATGLIVSNFGSVVSSTLYQLEPLNGYAVTGEPYTQITLPYGAWVCAGSLATVTVTAKWGWTAVPDRAVEAVKMIGKDYVTARTSRFGYIETSGGPASSSRNWLALNTLAGLRRVEAFGIG